MALGAKTCVPFLVVAVVAASGESSAQAPAPPFELDLPRMDASAGIGWFSGSFTRAPEGRDWFHDAAWWGGQFGYYWTENIKLEAEVSGAGEGRGWSNEERIGPTGRPYYTYREHGLSTRTVSAGLVYQFGHNLSLHPFVGAGVDVDFARNHVVTRGPYPGDPTEFPPPAPDETLRETRAGAFGLVGVKAYFNERFFFRADFKAGTSGPERKTIVRLGLGVDF